MFTKSSPFSCIYPVAQLPGLNVDDHSQGLPSFNINSITLAVNSTISTTGIILPSFINSNETTSWKWGTYRHLGTTCTDNRGSRVGS